MIGGMPNTQRVMDFCHQHGIVPKFKLITHSDLDRVFQELSSKNDSIYRSLSLIYNPSNYRYLIGMFWILRPANDTEKM